MNIPPIGSFIARWPELGLVPSVAWQITRDCENQVLFLLARLGPGY